MEWLKKLLETAGIDNTKIDGIVTEFNKESAKHLIPKEKYNEVAEAKKQLDLDIAARDLQLEELSKTAGASDSLKAEITRLQTDNQAAADKYAADLKDLTLTNAIKTALNGKVHDEGLAAGLIDREKLVLDGDKVVGLDEQLTGLQESKAFLFKSDESQQQTQTGFQGKVGGNGQGTGQASNEQLSSIFGNTKQ